MRQKWQYWNTVSRKWLWILVIIGLIASIPIIADRVKTESSAKNVELAFDYRDLVEVAAYQAHPQDFIDQKLTELKDAGVITMAVYESTLEEFRKSERITIYDSVQAANLTGQIPPVNENYTYILFTSDESREALSSIIEDTFERLDIPVNPWTYLNEEGLVLQTPTENAKLKPMLPDPIAMAELHERGFNIMPRLGDALPYDQEAAAAMMETFEQYGVSRILFDGDKVKGYNDNEDMKSLSAFAELMNKHGIGLAAIENLKKPQSGFSTLAYLTDYNVTRLYSLSESDANLDVNVISDRFALATKDRNIRMLYLNAAPARSALTAQVTDPLDNLMDALGEEGKAVQRMEDNGFVMGKAEPFDVAETGGERYFKAVVVVGSVAMIALMISYFIPFLTLPAFVLGLIGSAGLFLLRPTLLEQALALLAAISAPTVAMILAVRKINAAQVRKPDLSVKSRLSKSILLYVWTSILSFVGVPFMIALLNNITYSLVIDQFRGVSILYSGPVLLVAIYVFFYLKSMSVASIRQLLNRPITILMIVAVGIVGVVGYYYMTRTGNAGTVLPFEAQLRTFLENTFGVRPRNKEFLLGHPMFVVGAFIALKYRHGIYLLIIAAIAQLSMVGTFAHIHTPVHLSLIRGLLGLGLGLVVGLIAILVWQVLEGCWKKWSPILLRK
ncbi:MULTISPECIES: DUF5693 family protein [unclassified Paenibacillus]|uniref:DUF5693 family protein n=1 Tax=unclassified Paenibacillus TaxID=185978 RepID=UPI00089A78D9|nr:MULTISPECIES: DUF5693 family protein [unclassified Paenibacillus]OMC66498.1 hypothetical protein BK126_21090 [Paenibacillus sp. FSL H7-0326]SDW84374.1 hypothetical protein SAMN05518848_10398 [Paenibacillus sp. PDC88]